MGDTVVQSVTSWTDIYGNAQSTNVTVYNAKVTGETPTINSANRTWVKDVTLEIMASAKK